MPATTAFYPNRLRYLLALGILFLISTCSVFATVPANDNFANRITLSGTTTGSNVNATQEDGESPFGGGRTVWWTFTPAVSGAVAISAAGSNFDTMLAVYTGDAVGALTTVATNDDYYNLQSRVAFNAVAGTPYQIAVDGYQGATGSIQLARIPAGSINLSSSDDNEGYADGGGIYDSGDVRTITATPYNGYFFTGWMESGTLVSTFASYQFTVTGDRTLVANFAPITAPANDNFADRATLSGTAVSNNTLATKEPGEPLHAGYYGGASVWWTWTASSSGPAHLILNTSFNPVIAVYTGSSLDSLDSVASAASGELWFTATKGTTYQIAVDTAYGAVGAIELTFTPPPESQLQVPNTAAGVKKQITVPVQVVATGYENSFSFSVNFDPAILNLKSVQLGATESGASLTLDNTQLANGSIGVVVSQGVGQTFAAGLQDLLEIKFSPVTADADISIGFGDSPVTRGVLDTGSTSLGSTYVDGTLSVRAMAQISLSADPQEGGSVTGGGEFRVGSVRTIRAKAAPGWVFAGWSDSVNSAIRKVTVAAQDTTYTAEFLPSLSRWKGTYIGHLEAGGPSLVNVTLGANNGFSASIQINGQTYRFHGKLDANGQFDRIFTSPAGWEVTLQLNNSDGTFSGNLQYGSNGTAIDLSRTMADSHDDTSSVQGKYTFLLKPNYNDTSSPLAIGYGAVNVSKTGFARMVGKLGDGTAFSQSSPLTEGGNWQIYAPIYSSNGYLGGNIVFENLQNTDLDGTLTWFKPARPKDKLYPSGVSSSVFLVGSAFDSRTRFTDRFTGSGVNFYDGTGSGVYGNSLLFSRGFNQLGTAVDLNNQSASFSMNPHNGLLSGSLSGIYRNAKGRLLNTPAQGAILQKTSTGGGFFFDGRTDGEFDISY